MRHGVGDEKKKGPIRVAVNEFLRLLRITARDSFLVGWPFKDLVMIFLAHRLALHQRDVPVLVSRIEIGLGAEVIRPVHIVRIRDSEPGIETVPCRQVFGPRPQVPLPDDPGGITEFSQCLGDRGVLIGDATGLIGKEHASPGAIESAAVWLLAGEKGASAGRAHRRGNVEVGPPLALFRHGVQIRRANGRVPVA